MPDNSDNFFNRRGASQLEVPVQNDPFERTEDQKNQIQSVSKDRRGVNMVRDFMARSDAYRQPHLRLAIESRRLYENWQDDGQTLVGRARMRSPIGFTIIETQTPQLHSIFFSDDDVIELSGENAFAAELELPMTQFVNDQLKDSRIKTKGYSYQKAMLLDGTSFAKIPYKFVQKSVIQRTRRRDEQTGEIIVEKVKATKSQFDGPDVELISIHDFFPDWSVKDAGNILDMRGCVQRFYMTHAELKATGLYKNLDELELSIFTKRGTKVRTSNGQLTSPYWGEDFRNQHDNLQDNFAEAKTAGKIEIWEYWGLYDPKGDGDYEEYVITIANGDVELRCIENPYDDRFKPFVATPNYPRDGEFYGIPELVVQKYNIKELNSMKNARLDAINISQYPMWKIEKNSGINLKQLVSKPNGVILTNSNTAIEELRSTGPSNVSAEEILQIQQDISTTAAMGIANATLSSAGKALGRTKDGVNLISSFADNRIKLKAQLLSETFFQPLTQMFLAHNRQFISEDQLFTISNPQLKQVDPEGILPVEAFSINFNYRVKTDLEGGDTAGFIDKVDAAIPFVQAVEQSQPGTFKMEVFANQVLRRLFKANLPNFVNSPEERQAMQMQKLAAEQAVNASIGANTPQPNKKP